MDPLNKVVIVTGGARGIGYEICNQFLAAGAKVILILDLNYDIGNQAANDLNTIYGVDKAYYLKCDIRKDLQTVSKKISDKFGYVDVLVNNAGVSEQDPDDVIDINLKALIKWSFKYWQLMRKDKGGCGGVILNISSAQGLKTEPHFPVYHASKFGVIGFSRSLGHEFNYKRTGVRVITLCPGYTKTTLTNSIRTFDDDVLLNHYRDRAKIKECQEVGVVGKAAVEIYKMADSGSVWLIQENKPILEVRYQY